MNYQQALERTHRLKNFAEEFNVNNRVRYIVVPENQNEMINFLHSNPSFKEDQNFEECIRFSSDGNFIVYRLELSENQD
ncbi:hypothetical protein OMO38_00485 [Chryseobacterium sp. 09-1422]|uniref:Uncharacterized protein n=1 Tax=Chryseobacterium kimseyorum TaxID=2984028 RepID=A0ABT3HT81_9FLAO|nr:hypothetical protein [Chryseobacterium kimseyorum]MCW3166990.1 hypothetical protein [Chryseobacterium kimseyorum]